MDDASTSTLVRELSRDRIGAFRRIYLRFAPGLLVWANLRIPAALRHRLEPEDLLQDTWLAALRGLDQFDESAGGIRSWLFAIANHALIAELRRLAVRDRKGLPRAGADAADLAQIADSLTSVTRRFAREDQIDQLLAFARGLDEDSYRLLLFRGLEALPFAEVARRLAVSEEACEMRWRRLLAKVREQFDAVEWLSA